MAILEASGKQEPETKEAPAGPLEEVRVCSPLPKPEVPCAPPPTHTSPLCCLPQGGFHLLPHHPLESSLGLGSQPSLRFCVSPRTSRMT